MGAGLAAGRREVSEAKSRIDIQNLFSLKGLTALVTGGCGGLGGGIAEGFVLAGANVAIADKNTAALAEKTAALSQFGTVSGHECDVTDAKTVERAVREVEAKYGRIDILCNAAGIAPRTPAVELQMEEFRRAFDVNVAGTWQMSQAVGLRMIEAGRGGKIINIGSVRGLVGHPLGYVAYGTSKGAVHQFTRQLATEWAKYRINVNCLAPSVINTPLASYIVDDPERRKMFLDRIPFARVAEAEDFVGAAIFMASPAGNFMTGQILFMDGGATAG
jgi:gluconate 5-dehydrogenase